MFSAVTQSIFVQNSKFLYIRVGDLKGFHMICMSKKNSKKNFFRKFENFDKKFLKNFFFENSKNVFLYWPVLSFKKEILKIHQETAEF